MTRAPPVTEIMGQPHLWGEFLVLMLSFFLEWYSHSRNLCLSCMGALPKSRESRRCRRPPHPPSSHSFSSRPFHFSHIPHIPHIPHILHSFFIPLLAQPFFAVSRFPCLSARGSSGRPHKWKRSRTCLETP